MTGAAKNPQSLWKSDEIMEITCKMHKFRLKYSASHPDFWDTLGSFGRIMGNQALLDHQVRD